MAEIVDHIHQVSLRRVTILNHQHIVEMVVGYFRGRPAVENRGVESLSQSSPQHHEVEKVVDSLSSLGAGCEEVTRLIHDLLGDHHHLIAHKPVASVDTFLLDHLSAIQKALNEERRTTGGEKLLKSREGIEEAKGEVDVIDIDVGDI